MVEVVQAMEGLTFGCDPELFIVNSDGEFVSAEGLIPGTKQEPFRVEGGAVQVDGMAAEFNIDPVTNFEDWLSNVTRVQGALRKMLPTGHKLVPAASVTFSKEVWDATPDHAKQLGCEPDFNAWTMEINPPPENLENPTMRCAGGHIHIGWTEDIDVTDPDHVSSCTDLVRQLDWYLGSWSCLADKDKVRRSLYGKAGAMRFKPYGVEYRVLSNFWLTNKAGHLRMWNRLQTGINSMRTNFLPDLVDASYMTKYKFNSRLIESINSGALDQKLMQNFRNPVITL